MLTGCPAAATRVGGCSNSRVAVAALALGGRPGAALIAISYAVLAAMSIRLMAVARGADCGCFGRPSRISHWHTAVNLGFLLVGLAGLRPAPAGWPRCWPTGPATACSCWWPQTTLAYLSYLMMTALPELLRLAVRTEVAPMTAVIAVETVVLALLCVLVAGLLRGYASVLQRLHALDGGGRRGRPAAAVPDRRRRSPSRRPSSQSASPAGTSGSRRTTSRASR